MPSSSSLSPVQSIWRVAEVRPVRHEAPSSGAWPAESGAIPVEHLHLRAAPVDEHEQRARQRVAAERVAGERVEAVEGFAHVDRLAINMDGRRLRGRTSAARQVEDHAPPRSSRSVKRPSAAEQARIDKTARLAWRGRSAARALHLPAGAATA